jgi:hypothetical protein
MTDRFQPTTPTVPVTQPAPVPEPRPEPPKEHPNRRDGDPK